MYSNYDDDQSEQVEDFNSETHLGRIRDGSGSYEEILLSKEKFDFNS